MSGMLDHAAAMAVHARRRAWQRLGLVLTDRDLAALAAACRRATPKARSDARHGGRPVYRLRWRGRIVWCVYDEAAGAVVTLLAGPPFSVAQEALRR